MTKHILTIGFLLLASIVTQLEAADTLAVVVGKGLGLDNVSSADLTRIFKCEKSKAPDGTKIVVIMRDTSAAERAAALAGIFKMSEADYNKYFLQATFTGAVQAAPKALSSGAAVKQFVSGTPGGIGYIKSSEIDDTVKVLKVDGKSPTDADYPLKLESK